MKGMFITRSSTISTYRIRWYGEQRLKSVSTPLQVLVSCILASIIFQPIPQPLPHKSRLCFLEKYIKLDGRGGRG